MHGARRRKQFSKR
ncbi:MAG: hypothetical protein B7X42_06050 [Thiomonas sp. 14-66-4]|nr:MAG: hypothetical protein B7X42_06050 [Thiomonas sp. 14-66-4]